MSLAPMKWLDSLPAPKGVLEEVQRRGRQSLITLGLPTRSCEAWRLTDLNRLRALLDIPVYSGVKEKKPEQAPSRNTWPSSPSNGFRLVVDSTRESIDSSTLPTGFTCLTPDELRQSLGRTLQRCECNSEWAVEVNHASATEVLALRVNGRVPPLELVMPASPNEFSATRVVLILEEKADLELLQIVLGCGSSAQSHVLEIYLANGASLRHGWVALGGGEGSLLGHLTIEQEPDSNYCLTTINHGWALGRLEPRLVQLHGQANTSIKGLQITRGVEQAATHSYVRFDGPEGSLEQLNKSVATNRSHSIFNGAISVPRAAQKTNASQLSRNLLLSTHACIDTKPELEIVADDVRCQHGATISQLQQDELFYMRSRGIELQESTKLLLEGYCREIVALLPAEIDRWDLLNYLLATFHE